MQGIHHVPVHLECDWLAEDTKPSASVSGQPKAAPLLLLGSETNSNSSGWEGKAARTGGLGMLLGCL